VQGIRPPSADNQGAPLAAALTIATMPAFRASGGSG